MGQSRRLASQSSQGTALQFHNFFLETLSIFFTMRLSGQAALEDPIESNSTIMRIC